MENFVLKLLVIILISITLFFLMKIRIDPIKDGSLGTNHGSSEEVVLKEVTLEDKYIKIIPYEQLMKGPYFLPHDHFYLIQHIRMSLFPPSVLEGYNISNPKVVFAPSHVCQPQAIRDILGEMKDGFFVEAGALDGEFGSNTLMFERDYGWRGLLVEANPENMRNLMKMQRKAWAINICLSNKPYPSIMSFLKHKREHQHRGYAGQGKIVYAAPAASKRYSKVQCVPLYSIMLALNITTVDYFSLDIEGMELDVLMTIPWDKLNIRTLTVEFQNIPAGKHALRKYMESVGYVTYADIGHIQDGAIDYIFHRKDVIPVVKSPKKTILC